MSEKVKKHQYIRPDDWYGNNATFLCPLCNRAFIVSALLRATEKGKRICPRCTGEIKCVGVCTGSSSNGEAYAYFVHEKV